MPTACIRFKGAKRSKNGERLAEVILTAHTVLLKFCKLKVGGGISAVWSGAEFVQTWGFGGKA